MLKNTVLVRRTIISMEVAGLVVFGSILIANADGVTYYQNTNGQESGDLGGGIGASMISFGIPLIIAGSIIGPLGIRKINYYKKRLSIQNCMLNITRNKIALHLTF